MYNNMHSGENGCFVFDVIINTPNMPRDEVFTQVNIRLDNRPGTHLLSQKVDTGAQGNTLTLRAFHQMFPEKLKVLRQTSNVNLTAYNGTPINCVCTVHIQCKFKESPSIDTRYFVVDVPGTAILRLPSCEIMNVVTMHCAIEQQPVYNFVDDILTAHPQQFDWNW